MLTIIFGAIVSVSIGAQFRRRNKFLHNLGSCIIAFGLIASFAVGIFAPISGYNQWKLKTSIPICPLTNTTPTEKNPSGTIYATRSIFNVYCYRSEAHGYETLKKDVIELEDICCKKPELQIYVRTAKRSIWTFGAYSNTQYILYVPEGTISYKDFH